MSNLMEQILISTTQVLQKRNEPFTVTHMAAKAPTSIAGKQVGPVGYGLLGESHSIRLTGS